MISDLESGSNQEAELDYLEDLLEHEQQKRLVLEERKSSLEQLLKEK